MTPVKGHSDAEDRYTTMTLTLSYTLHLEPVLHDPIPIQYTTP